MERLSLIIFSRNDVKNALELIDDMYGVADEILLFDSSDKKWHEFVKREKKRQKLSKLKIFRVVALGYPDPLRMYALSKCKNRWVLLLDTDESLSKDLKEGIKHIISSTNASAFAIKRYEEVSKSGKRTNFFTWQIRLFKKDKVTFKGIIHEQPEVVGKVEKLENGEWHINHLNEKRKKNTAEEYSKMEKFYRFSYKIYNSRFLDYVSKIVMGEDRNVEKQAIGKIIKNSLLAYEKLTLKRPDDELTNFDYLMFYLIRDCAYALKQGNISALSETFQLAKKHADQINKWKSEHDGWENFEISNKINSIGVTKYLRLDREKTIEELNKKYTGKKQGVTLLMHLLKEKYHAQNQRG